MLIPCNTDGVDESGAVGRGEDAPESDHDPARKLWGWFDFPERTDSQSSRERG